VRVRGRGRTTLLVLLGAVAVHELRWVLAPAADHGRHGYLATALPALAALAVLVAARTGLLLARALRRGAPPPAAPSLRRLWPRLTAVLVAAFLLQETAEALAFHEPGHGVLHAVLGDGGWLALPLSAAVALLVGLGLRGAAAALARVAARHRPAPRRARALRRPPRPAPRARRGDLLARHLAGRAPPALLGA